MTAEQNLDRRPGTPSSAVVKYIVTSLDAMFLLQPSEYGVDEEPPEFITNVEINRMYPEQVYTLTQIQLEQLQELVSQILSQYIEGMSFIEAPLEA